MRYVTDEEIESKIFNVDSSRTAEVKPGFRLWSHGRERLLAPGKPSLNLFPFLSPAGAYP